MKILLFLLCVSLGFQSAFAMDENLSDALKTKVLSPEELVQIQLDAYNNRDIDAFLNTYSSDIKIYNFPVQLTTSGKENMRVAFSNFFDKTPNLNAKVSKKIIKDNFVIFHEVVTGLSNGKALEVVAIYEVNTENKIKNLWFVW